jgi:hypothetical protein
MSMIFSENRFPLFGIMLESDADSAVAPKVPKKRTRADGTGQAKLGDDG